MSFSINAWNKVCGEHKLKKFSLFTVKLLLVLKKVVASKYLNGTTKVVVDIEQINSSDH